METLEGIAIRGDEENIMEMCRGTYVHGMLDNICHIIDLTAFIFINVSNFIPVTQN